MMMVINVFQVIVMCVIMVCRAFAEDHCSLYSQNQECHTATEQFTTRGSPHKYDPRFQGIYTFPVNPIPRMQCDDPDALAAIDNGTPVILLNCTFANPALKWSIDYLLENLRDEGHPTYVSRNRRFLFYEEDRISGDYAKWKPPHVRKLVGFQEFMEMVKEMETSDNGTRSYFQSPLAITEGMSASMEHDINSFDYPWLLNMVKRQGWGTEVVNLLLVGMRDVVTPTHYDILENFYVQVSGYKRVILFSPEHFRSLYPFPVAHPHDRQTQVNFDEPDFARFPRFQDITGMETVLESGEVLYIPSFWWHYIESEKNNMTISVNFWFEPRNKTDELPSDLENENDLEIDNIETQGANTDKESTGKASEQDIASHNTRLSSSENPKNQSDTDVKPLTAAEYLRLRRQVEMSLFKATADHSKVRQLLDEMLSGRFDFLDRKNDG